MKLSAYCAQNSIHAKRKQTAQQAARRQSTRTIITVITKSELHQADAHPFAQAIDKWGTTRS